MLTDYSNMQSITTAMGIADAQAQALVDPNNSASALSKAISIRHTVTAQKADADFDSATALEQSMRSVERSLPTSAGALTQSLATALSSYVTAQTGTSLRLYYKSGAVAFTDQFRALWRRVQKEELIVKVAHAACGTSNAWGAMAQDAAISLGTPLEIRVPALIGAAAITVNATLTKASGGSDLVTVTIPLATPAASSFTLAGPTGKYVGVSAVTLTGGTQGDTLEFWTR